MDRNFRKELNQFGMIFLDEEKEWVMDLLDDFDKVRKERDEYHNGVKFAIKELRKMRGD